MHEIFTRSVRLKCFIYGRVQEFLFIPTSDVLYSRRICAAVGCWTPSVRRGIGHSFTATCQIRNTRASHCRSEMIAFCTHHHPDNIALLLACTFQNRVKFRKTSPVAEKLHHSDGARFAHSWRMHLFNWLLYNAARDISKKGEGWTGRPQSEGASTPSP